MQTFVGLQHTSRSLNACICYEISISVSEDYEKMIYPFPKQQILDSSKLKEFADDNFKLDENSGKLSKQVENSKGKGEIALYEQFLFYPQCFQKTHSADMLKPGLVW